MKIKGVTIQNGNLATNGGGIFSEKVIPKIEECIIQNNTAKEDGAGVYAPKGVQDLHMLLFEGNAGKSAVYLESRDTVKAERVVFSGNKGAAFAIKNANMEFVNSIFYGNDTAVSAEESNVNLIHCTSTKNTVGVMSKNSVVKTVNSIFWNEREEFKGNGFEVEYSCVRGGYAGEGNINEDPMFVDAEKPRGEDDEWGTYDDDLIVGQKSPCIDKGRDFTDVVVIDARNFVRPLESGFDIGAYEIALLPEGDSPADFGIINLSNKFVREKGIGDFAVQASSKKDLYKLLFSRSALTLRIYVDKNDYVKKNIREGYGFVSVQKDGKNISGNINPKFYRTDENKYGFIFTSRKFENNEFVGKPIFLVAETDTDKIKAIQDTNYYYILPVDTNTAVTIKVEVPTNQFKK